MCQRQILHIFSVLTAECGLACSPWFYSSNSYMSKLFWR